MQRQSFYLAAGANLLGVVLNSVLMIVHLVRGDASWEVSLVGLCVTAVVLWLVVTNDARARTKQATADSYLEEQLADTRLKQFITEKVCSGAVEVRNWPGGPESDTRRH